MAVFLALDVATFWSQSWLLHRNAPFNYALLVLALVTAGLFYLSARVAFPGQVEEGASLDEHYWARRRLILLGVAGANLINGVLITVLLLAGGGRLSAMRWAELGAFFVLAFAAALLPRSRAAAAALVLLLLLGLEDLAQSALALAAGGPWELGTVLKP